MSGLAALLQPGQRWKVVLLVVACCGAVLAGGIAVGFASSGKHKAHQPAPAAAAAAAGTRLMQLPLPDSTAAWQQLLANTASPGWLRELYVHEKDSTTITAEHTEALLRMLQRALQALPPADTVAAADSQSIHLLAGYQPNQDSNTDSSSSTSRTTSSRSSKSSSSSSSSSSVQPSSTGTSDLQPFITAADDVLSYLRSHQSRALLQLLREFSASGLQGLAALQSNPAVLRHEVQQLLQPASLQRWYLEAARSRVGPAGAAGAGGLQMQQEHRQVQVEVADASVRHSHSHRRLMAAVAAATADPASAPFDLASALLSKMQGAAQPAAAATQLPAVPAYSAGAVAAGWPPPPLSYGLPDSSSHTTSGTAARADSLSSLSSGLSGQPAPASAWAPATAARSASSPVPAAAAAAVAVPAGVLGVSAVADPDYLAFDFEELEAQAKGAGDAFTMDDDVYAWHSSGNSRHSSSSSSSSSGGGGDSGSSSRRSSKSSTSSRRTAGRHRAGRDAAADTGWVNLHAVADDDAASGPDEAADASGTPAVSLQLLGSAANATASRGADSGAALCSIQQHSPAGLQRIAESVMCPLLGLSLQSQSGWVFRSITVPVVFHCLTFSRALSSQGGAAAAAAAAWAAGQTAQVALPPVHWHARQGAESLIDQANKVFFNTGIRFKLQEVRHDASQHAYLQQPSLAAWQSCTHNAAAPAAGAACLRAIAERAQASPNAVHVFVAGSRDQQAYCSADDVAAGSVCRTVAPGYSYSSARGPWTPGSSSLIATWREESVADNLMFLSWDTFDPSSANSGRFGHRGGSIFASQLAQHLGISASAAAAPAAPAGRSCAVAPQQLPALAAWCSRFRQGLQPLWAELELSAATSCPAVAFNVLQPSAPDDCAMTFTALQAAQMQASVAMWRPKLLAASTAA